MCSIFGGNGRPYLFYSCFLFILIVCYLFSFAIKSSSNMADIVLFSYIPRDKDYVVANEEYTAHLFFANTRGRHQVDNCN